MYSSVNFVKLVDLKGGVSSLTPVLEYLREVERLENRQLRTYSFKNKVLSHLNKCFSSGPEYAAVLLSAVDAIPANFELSKTLLQSVSVFRGGQ